MAITSSKAMMWRLTPSTTRVQLPHIQESIAAKAVAMKLYPSQADRFRHRITISIPIQMLQFDGNWPFFHNQNNL